jgi:hypothetical protein
MLILLLVVCRHFEGNVASTFKVKSSIKMLATLIRSMRCQCAGAEVVINYCGRLSQ